MIRAAYTWQHLAFDSCKVTNRLPFMRFKVAILAANDYQNFEKLQYCVEEGEGIRKALQQMDIIEGDLEYLPDFTRLQAFELADRLQSAKRVLLVIASHGYQEKGNILFRPVDSQRQDDDVPLDRFVANVRKHGSEGVFVCFFAACRVWKDPHPRSWDRCGLHALLFPKQKVGQGGAHITLLGCALGEPIKDTCNGESFLGDLARSLLPGTSLQTLAQEVIKSQESDLTQCVSCVSRGSHLFGCLESEHG